MSYGKMGQQRPGTPRTVSTNAPHKGGSSAGNVQSQRGYGPSKSTHSANHGRASTPLQNVRGYRQQSAKNPTVRNTSAGRIKKGRA